MREPQGGAGVPAAFVRAILAAYTRRGLDGQPALLRAGIAPEDIASDDPARQVALGSFEALSSHAMRELDDEALGWFSRRLPWGSYGMLLRASLTAPTLDVALRRWCRHHGLLTEDMSLTPRIEAGDCVVSLREVAPLGVSREFGLVSLLRNLHGVACWLIDSRIPLTGTEFPFLAPPHAEAYGRMFPGPITFDAPETLIRFDAGYMRLPIVRDDAALRHLLGRPIGLMARQYRQDRLLSQRIIRLISANGSADTPEMAARLNISVRSLQRHLREEGTSLIALRSEARRRRAEDLLGRSDLPLKRVARLVGYGDEASFGRAFRGWTGRTPAEFRRSVIQPPGRA